MTGAVFMAAVFVCVNVSLLAAFALSLETG
jgi:hypothetical protein